LLSFLFSFLIIPELKVVSIVFIVEIVRWQNMWTVSTLSKEHSWECVILMMCWILVVYIICALLILCCLMGGVVLIREHQVMDMMWLFPFQMLVWIHWLWHFSCII